MKDEYQRKMLFPNNLIVQKTLNLQIIYMDYISHHQGIHIKFYEGTANYKRSLLKAHFTSLLSQSLLKYCLCDMNALFSLEVI